MVKHQQLSSSPLPQFAQCLYVLWISRKEQTQSQVSQTIGFHERTERRWLSWYRQEGFYGLRNELTCGARRRAKSLTLEQQKALLNHVAKGFMADFKAKGLTEMLSHCWRNG